jgi:hypothetical protein
VSLVIDVVVVTGGILVGRWVARSIRARAAKRARGDASEQEVASRPARDPLAGFHCKLGDVVVRVAERDEAWLAGALVFEEERPVAALFVAPEAGGDRALFVREAAGSGVTWLAPLASGELTLATEPPHTFEHRGTRFERARRLPVRVARIGTGAPSVGEQAVVAEYTGPAGERLLIVAGSEHQLAWRGVALAEGEYDVLPGGQATLEP